MIEFKSVTKIYPQTSSRAPNGQARQHPALDRVSLTIPTGGFVFVVGPSGAGKSTLARLITREERATSGRVIVDGHDVASITDVTLPYYRRHLGIVFQDFRLFRSMTAAENVEFAALAVGASMPVAKRRARAVLSHTGLSDKCDCFPDELSGGECQRVAIARAIVNRPKIIIADEPTGNLDHKLSVEIISLLMDINKSTNATVLVITHDLATVKEVGGAVISLDQGRLITNGLQTTPSRRLLP